MRRAFVLPELLAALLVALVLLSVLLPAVASARLAGDLAAVRERHRRNVIGIYLTWADDP